MAAGNGNRAFAGADGMDAVAFPPGSGIAGADEAVDLTAQGLHHGGHIGRVILKGDDLDLESVGVSRRIKKGDQKIVLIRSLWPLGSFLKFEGQLARRNIQLGYLDACKAFNKVD